ncbi:hypothetical protein F2P56_004484, partial [Juglans regia]
PQSNNCTSLLGCSQAKRKEIKKREKLFDNHCSSSRSQSQIPPPPLTHLYISVPVILQLICSELVELYTDAYLKKQSLLCPGKKSQQQEAFNECMPQIEEMKAISSMDNKTSSY